MAEAETKLDIEVTLSDFVALIEIQRPPYNFLDYDLIQQIAETLEALDENPECRAIVLASQGKAFCAGANFGDGSGVKRDGGVAGQSSRGAAGRFPSRRAPHSRDETSRPVHDPDRLRSLRSPC